MFRYVKGGGTESERALGGKGLASLPPTMPLIALQVVLQQMAVGPRSANPFAAQRPVSMGTYL